MLGALHACLESTARRPGESPTTNARATSHAREGMVLGASSGEQPWDALHSQAWPTCTAAALVHGAARIQRRAHTRAGRRAGSMPPSQPRVAGRPSRQTNDQKTLHHNTRRRSLIGCLRYPRTPSQHHGSANALSRCVRAHTAGSETSTPRPCGCSRPRRTPPACCLCSSALAQGGGRRRTHAGLGASCRSSLMQGDMHTTTKKRLRLDSPGTARTAAPRALAGWRQHDTASSAPAACGRSSLAAAAGCWSAAAG